MSHSYCSSLYHCVFSTKNRVPSIPPELQPRLWSFMGGIARDRGLKSLITGGTVDHVHIILSLPATIPISDAMREIKGGSSLWMHETIHEQHFAWQEGYGAFSIGWKQVEATVAYIEQQAEHHKKRDFEAEFLAILKMHRIEYDPRYVLG